MRSLLRHSRTRAFALLTMLGWPALAAAPQALPQDRGLTRAAQSYGQLPLAFEANRGQLDGQVKFLSRGQGYSIFLTASALTLTANRSAQSRSGVLRMELSGASPSQPEGADPLPGVANYFLGNDASQWQTGVPTYPKVRYAAVYPGIDLVYYGNRQQLEYDFAVAPGAEPNRIRLRFSGTRRLALTPSGDLLLRSQGGPSLQKPVLYQIENGRRVSVQGSFRILAQNTVGFQVGEYDHSRPLVIDPVLDYATYLGGSGADHANAIAVDESGAAYVAGVSCSANFPATAAAYQPRNLAAAKKACTAFVSKLNPAGTALEYSTFLGGTGWTAAAPPFDPTQPEYADGATAIAVDRSGNAYITGYTYSINFPVTKGAFQPSTFAGVGNYTAFVSKLNAPGTKLLYSTYLGGNGQQGGFNGLGDYAASIAVDSKGSAYVTGYTYSTTGKDNIPFPTTPGAFQTKDGYTDTGFDSDPLVPWATAFVTKFNPAGTALDYSTYLGGSGNYDGSYGLEGDQASSIAVDPSGDAWVTGSTQASNFPVTANAFQKKNAGSMNVFVTGLNPAGSALVYSTYLGGNNEDSASALALDASGDVYLTGRALSVNFPITRGAFNSSTPGPFLTKFHPGSGELAYSTFLGGYDAYALAVDTAGNAYVAGAGYNMACPTTTGALSAPGYGAYLLKMNPSGSAPLYASSLESSSTPDAALGVALDPAGSAYLTGIASSKTLLVTPKAFQPNYRGAALGGSNAFVAKLQTGSFEGTTQTFTRFASFTNVVKLGQPLVSTIQVTNQCGTIPATGAVTFNVDGANEATVPLNANAQATYSNAKLPAGTHTVTAQYNGSTTLSPSTSAGTPETVTMPATLTLTSSANPQTVGHSFTLTAVAKAVGSNIVPTGTVGFEIDNGYGYQITTAPLIDGTASFNVYSQYLALGSYLIGAYYVDESDPSIGTAKITQLIENQTPRPGIAPNPGTYAPGVSVRLIAATGQTVYYTTDGTTPTTASPVYTKAFKLTSTQTVKAIASQPGMTLSPVTSATYTIQ